MNVFHGFFLRFCSEISHKKIKCSAALGRVCMKLVIIMGVTWVADVFSWAHSVVEKNSSDSTIKHDVHYYLWYTMDAINALQGVLIFVVVATQPQVFKEMAVFVARLCGGSFSYLFFFLVPLFFLSRFIKGSDGTCTILHTKS